MKNSNFCTNIVSKNNKKKLNFDYTKLSQVYSKNSYELLPKYGKKY